MALTSPSGVSEDAMPLANMLQEVLDRVVTLFESYSVPVPERRYWTLAEPVVDCEQLVVSFIQMYIGFPGDEANEPRRCNDPRSATIHVKVAREVPTVGPSSRAPSAEAIQAASVISACDAWCLLNSAADLDTWAINEGSGLGIIATVDVSEPLGGYQTTTMTLTMAVP